MGRPVFLDHVSIRAKCLRDVPPDKAFIWEGDLKASRDGLPRPLLRKKIRKSDDGNNWEEIILGKTKREPQRGFIDPREHVIELRH